jgi:hypothetical protein
MSGIKILWGLAAIMERLISWPLSWSTMVARARTAGAG